MPRARAGSVVVTLLVCVVSTVAAVGVLVVAPAAAEARRFHGVPLPLKGEGYVVPRTWAERGLTYGTPQLVGLIQRAARKVAEEFGDANLYVGDLSRPTGGASAWHRSHRTGRDADLIFYALDEHGRPAPPPAEMAVFLDDGSAVTVAEDGDLVRLVFDTPRNWALVRALLEDPEVRVTRLFIARPLKARLLHHAAALGEPEHLLARAAEVLVQPGDSAPHDDHIHVRIEGPLGFTPRWARAAKWKKHQALKHRRARMATKAVRAEGKALRSGGKAKPGQRGARPQARGGGRRAR